MIFWTINLTLKICFLFHFLFLGDICNYLFKTFEHSVDINPTYLGWTCEFVNLHLKSNNLDTLHSVISPSNFDVRIAFNYKSMNGAKYKYVCVCRCTSVYFHAAVGCNVITFFRTVLIFNKFNKGKCQNGAYAVFETMHKANKINPD